MEKEREAEATRKGEAGTEATSKAECVRMCVCERERYQRGGSDVKKKREGGRGHSVGERERTRERGEGGQ